MKTSTFSFDLPERLIAQYPSDERGNDRLLVVSRKTGDIMHLHMKDLPSVVEPGTLMVFNNTKVRKSRLFGTSCSSGGAVQFLLIERVDEFYWKAMVSKSKKQKPGKLFQFPENVQGEIEADVGELKVVRFSQAIDDAYLDAYGHVPLPPYIKRQDESMDAERYQTVFAEHPGSVAAPTAGLHFTPRILEELKIGGVEQVYITLHVGIGTFLPIRTEDIENHRMHEEIFEISDESAQRIEKAAAEGRNILAVGTTSLRALESAWHEGTLDRGVRKTDLFIYPGYKFKVVNRIFTNFHTPESSLFVLVCAFAGTELMKHAYRIAVENGYRFFSYGDAMYIL